MHVGRQRHAAMPIALGAPWMIGQHQRADLTPTPPIPTPRRRPAPIIDLLVAPTTQ
jgi:hypothetical protein